MDKVNKYRKIIRQTLLPFKNVHYAGSPDLKNEVILDGENDHYLVVTIGWDGETPVRDCIFHIDIIRGKIWIQEDNSDVEIASQLLDAGIPKSDIILGFQSPTMRQFSSFGIQ
jgi:XisI protein